MDRKIILYTLVDCDRCKLVKQMLDTHNVSYELIDDRQVLIERGFSDESFPIIDVNGEYIKEYVDILSWLRKNNYYSL
jgi:glutaredoxin